MKDLIKAIVYKALFDWKFYPEMRDEIREFFNSEWGESLCDAIHCNAKYLLKRLENMQ